jgi:Lon protease-like protein
VPLLRAIVEDLAAGRAERAGQAALLLSTPAGWACAMPNCLPIPLAAKQKLLEIEDSIDRLEIIYRFLESKGLLPDV